MKSTTQAVPTTTRSNMRSWALTALATHIRDGVAAGEMGDVDPEEAAHFLLAVRSGLKVAARSGAGFDALRAIAQMTLRSLRA